MKLKSSRSVKWCTIRHVNISLYLAIHPIYSQHNIYKFSFLPRTIIDWNILSPHSVDSASIDTFRARITKN